KRQAEDFLLEVESSKREGKYVDPRAGRIKFRQQAENWIKSQSSDAASREAVRSRLDSQIYPHFGDLPIAAVKPATVRDWLDMLDDKRLSRNYKAVLFTALSSILRLRRGRQADHAQPMGRPLAACPTSDPRRRPAAGVRPTQARQEAGCAAGPRCPGGHARARACLSGNRDLTLPWKEPAGEPVTVRLLVTGEAGRLYTGDLFHKVVWQGAFRAAGIDYRTRADGMYALRHFYASVLLSRGVSVKELAEYLGHSDPGFTLRTYTHLVPSSHERARAAIEAVFGAVTAQPPGDGLEAA
ncbi:MAG TPA: tyrosine-type recombinase/integrase, partial [Pseudonocardiaceae bacterium]